MKNRLTSRTKVKSTSAKAKKPLRKKLKKTKSSVRRKAFDEQDLSWPLARHVLFRPDRVGYVRKTLHVEGCVFCRASSNDVSFDTLTVFKSEHSLVVLNKYPYNSGHLLVLPKRHCGDLLKLSSIEYDDLMTTVRKAVEAVQTVYEPQGFNMGLNQGAVSGAGIPEHLHFHLVPRWGGDLNFFPLIAQTKVVIESLEQTYEKYFTYFSGKN